LRRRRTILRDIGRLVTLLAPAFGARQQNDPSPARRAFVLRDTLAGSGEKVLGARLARHQVAACEAHLMTPSNQMHSDALRCTQMHSDALRCTQMHSVAASEAHLARRGHTDLVECNQGQSREIAPRAARPYRSGIPWQRGPPLVSLSLPQPPRRPDLA
jgi:hypothetical protein